MFASAHFLLDTASLNEFAEPADCFLDRLSIANIQLNHIVSFESCRVGMSKVKSALGNCSLGTDALAASAQVLEKLGIRKFT
jgi:hypothetical protein